MYHFWLSGDVLAVRLLSFGFYPSQIILEFGLVRFPICWYRSVSFFFKSQSWSAVFRGKFGNRFLELFLAKSVIFDFCCCCVSLLSFSRYREESFAKDFVGLGIGWDGGCFAG